MRRENKIARLIRALSGMSQARISRETGIHSSLIASFESGKTVPLPEHLAKLARAVEFGVEEVGVLLDLAEAYQSGSREAVENAKAALHRMIEKVTGLTWTTYEQILALPAPAGPPAPEDREEAEEAWRQLAEFSPEGREAAVRLAPELQTWALCERICQESAREAAEGRGEPAQELARLAREIAERAPGPEEWRNCLRGYAAAHRAHALRIFGEPEAADAAMEEAMALWDRGADPGGLLRSPVPAPAPANPSGTPPGGG
jgi:transcriptional regulator with XRE-family HTH domain